MGEPAPRRAVLAFGSDWSVSTANPLEEIEVAVRRAAPDDRDGEPFLPAERVDLPTALDAFTSGSAYALRLEAETGSVTPGKLADLAVLDRDPFDPAAGPIGDARVLATLVEGRSTPTPPSTWADAPGKGRSRSPASRTQRRYRSAQVEQAEVGLRGRGSRRTARPVLQPGQELGAPVVVAALGLGVVQVGLHLGVGHGADQVEHRVAEGLSGRQVPGGGGRPVLVPRVRHLSA